MAQLITHSQYVTIIPFPLQQWLHERASLLPVRADLNLLALELFFLILPHPVYKM